MHIVIQDCSIRDETKYRCEIGILLPLYEGNYENFNLYDVMNSIKVVESKSICNDVLLFLYINEKYDQIIQYKEMFKLNKEYLDSKIENAKLSILGDIPLKYFAPIVFDSVNLLKYYGCGEYMDELVIFSLLLDSNKCFKYLDPVINFNSPVIINLAKGNHRILEFLNMCGDIVPKYLLKLLVKCIKLEYFYVIETLVKNIHDESLPNILFEAACNYSNMSIIEIISNLGSPIIYKSSYLINACKGSNKIELIEFLLNKGLDINTHDGEPLLKAIVMQHHQVVKYLISRKANVNIRDTHGLRSTVSMGHTGMAILLIENGANVNVGNGECLICASRMGNVELVEKLIEYGANVNLQNSQALRNAVHHGKENHFKIAKLLIMGGANVNSLNDDNNNYNGNLLVIAIRRRLPNFVKLLLDSGADPNLTPQTLVIALKSFNEKELTVNWLIEKGANVNFNNGEPLSIACMYNYTEIVKLLIKHGADVTLNYNYALFVAGHNGNKEIGNLLIENGASYNYLSKGHQIKSMY